MFQNITISSSPAVACEGDKVVGLESVIDTIIESVLKILYVIVRSEVRSDIQLLIYLIPCIQKLIHYIPDIRAVAFLRLHFQPNVVKA